MADITFTEEDIKFVPFQNVLVRMGEDDTWVAGIFSHYAQGAGAFVCIPNVAYPHCIPYAGNEHLLGTSINPVEPEPEFKFGDKVEVSSDGTLWLKAIYYRKSYDPTKPHGVVVENNTEVMLWEHCHKADW